MDDQRYRAATAASDLAAAGLLAEVLVPGVSGLQVLATGGDLATVAGSFAGAGLDSRHLEPGQLFAALRGEHADGRRFVPEVLARGHWVLTGPGPAGEDPLAGSPAPATAGVLVSRDPEVALSHLAACWRGRLTVPTVGVTGTNGKTTTKDFLAAMLGADGPVQATPGNFNNNLGLPVTVLGIRPDHRFAVIEMGASARGEIDELARIARPGVGVITNASPAHLAQFGSLAGIIAGKGELLDVLPADGAAVLNADSPGFSEWRDRAGCPVVSFGRKSGDHRWAWFPGDSVEEGPRVELDGNRWPVPLPGEHNGANLVAAVLAARALGLDDETIRKGLAAFQGSPHRGVLLTAGGLSILDDSYNANPRSMEAAARALARLPGAGRTIAVLGFMAELGADSDSIHRETGRRLAGVPVDVLLAVGESARPLGEGFDEAGGTAHYCATQAEAAAFLLRSATVGDRILLKGSRSAAMEKVLDALSDPSRKDQGA